MIFRTFEHMSNDHFVSIAMKFGTEFAVRLIELQEDRQKVLLMLHGDEKGMERYQAAVHGVAKRFDAVMRRKEAEKAGMFTWKSPVSLDGLS